MNGDEGPNYYRHVHFLLMDSTTPSMAELHPFRGKDVYPAREYSIGYDYEIFIIVFYCSGLRDISILCYILSWYVKQTFNFWHYC